LDVPIDYDPLVADPDYLVLGHFSQKWELYDEAIKSGKFIFIREYPPYKIYVQVRQ
jgi:hypothetical protein